MKILKPNLKDKHVAECCKRHDDLDAALSGAWEPLQSAQEALKIASWQEHLRRKTNPDSPPEHDLEKLEADYNEALAAVNDLRERHRCAHYDMHCAIAKAHGKRYAPNENPEDPDDNYFD